MRPLLASHATPRRASRWRCGGAAEEEERGGIALPGQEQCPNIPARSTFSHDVSGCRIIMQFALAAPHDSAGRTSVSLPVPRHTALQLRLLQPVAPNMHPPCTAAPAPPRRRAALEKRRGHAAIPLVLRPETVTLVDLASGTQSRPRRPNAPSLSLFPFSSNPSCGSHVATGHSARQLQQRQRLRRGALAALASADGRVAAGRAVAATCLGDADGWLIVAVRHPLLRLQLFSPSQRHQARASLAFFNTYSGGGGMARRAPAGGRRS